MTSLISLDPLPFKANSFDFVRICGIGFGVPEDEVRHVRDKCVSLANLTPKTVVAIVISGMSTDVW